MTEIETTESQRYGEDSPFVRLLETPGRVRILDVFLRRFNSELSASDISDLVSESTFSRNKDVLIELDIIEHVRSEGGKNYYRLNLDSELVELLGQFHTQLIAHTDAIEDGTQSLKSDYLGSVLMTKVATGGQSKAEKAPVEGRKKRQETLNALGYM